MDNAQKKPDKKILLAAGILAAAVAVLAILYFTVLPRASAGAKEITIEVIDDRQQSTIYTVNTDAEYLRQAMEDAEGLTFDGEDGDYGMTLTTVNGVTADFNVDSAYWSITVDGAYGQYGIDQQPIEDGHTYQLVYTSM